MIRRPPRSTQGRTLFPYTTLFRSRHHDLLVLLGHVDGGLGHRRRVRTHDGVHLVLGDELLVQTHGGGRHRLVVVDDELQLAAEQPTLAVDLLFAELVALVLVLAELRVRSRQRERGADADRSLGRGRHDAADGERERDRERGRCFRSHGEPPTRSVRTSKYHPLVCTVKAWPVTWRA